MPPAAMIRKRKSCESRCEKTTSSFFAPISRQKSWRQAERMANGGSERPGGEVSLRSPMERCGVLSGSTANMRPIRVAASRLVFGTGRRSTGARCGVLSRRCARSAPNPCWMGMLRSLGTGVSPECRRGADLSRPWEPGGRDGLSCPGRKRRSLFRSLFLLLLKPSCAATRIAGALPHSRWSETTASRSVTARLMPENVAWHGSPAGASRGPEVEASQYASTAWRLRETKELP